MTVVVCAMLTLCFYNMPIFIYKSLVVTLQYIDLAYSGGQPNADTLEEDFASVIHLSRI